MDNSQEFDYDFIGRPSEKCLNMDEGNSKEFDYDFKEGKDEIDKN